MHTEVQIIKKIHRPYGIYSCETLIKINDMTEQDKEMTGKHQWSKGFFLGEAY